MSRKIVPPPPAARMLVASSAAGAYPITRAIPNGGQIEPVGRPFAGTVLLESGRTALEEPERANAVPPGGLGEPGADLGEALPKVAFVRDHSRKDDTNWLVATWNVRGFGELTMPSTSSRTS
ncbi:hypothetical protein [Arthrobacter sp. D1-17]